MRDRMRWAMGKVSSRMARISTVLITLTGLLWMGSGVALASNGSPLAPGFGGAGGSGAGPAGHG